MSNDLNTEARELLKEIEEFMDCDDEVEEILCKCSDMLEEMINRWERFG